MPRLEWDKITDRVYETGLDKGVLYLPDGSAVPWNGLTSIVEKFDKQSTSIYYDGIKVNDVVVLGSFSASMTAITYPDEFVEVEGLGQLKRGVFFGDQKPKRFGLCYRTQVGNELAGENVGYKIHIIYNALAIPSDKTYPSVSENSSVIEFEWNITAIPEEILGFLPTAHVIINSLDIHPWLLEDLENILYGSETSSAELISMSDLITFINEWYIVKIIDNGDGTWTAISNRDGLITVDTIERLFTIINANATYLNGSTYVVSDTIDILEDS